MYTILVLSLGLAAGVFYDSRQKLVSQRGLRSQTIEQCFDSLQLDKRFCGGNLASQDALSDPLRVTAGFRITKEGLGERMYLQRYRGACVAADSQSGDEHRNQCGVSSSPGGEAAPSGCEAMAQLGALDLSHWTRCMSRSVVPGCSAGASTSAGSILTVGVGRLLQLVYQFSLMATPIRQAASSIRSPMEGLWTLHTMDGTAQKASQEWRDVSRHCLLFGAVFETTTQRAYEDLGSFSFLGDCEGVSRTETPSLKLTNEVASLGLSRQTAAS